MNGDELRIILCRLEAGMILSVPDEWIDKVFTGPRAQQARAVEEMARQYQCVCHQDPGVHRFERLGFPATG
ncbi:hypothetical protein MWN34_19015 [Ancylobacter sp. 6x-1]|uniref:Uncharacterized protein n=1 Tax=Ancylobacter crimeensis TaxID=2579147 RepID=A0ABT0DGI4_9HYPH|nr:hypothetical protein [Ancylobacter crimeensis]MCK0198994.1 hypothetical protein [Ancylobacter crimeensis]